MASQLELSTEIRNTSPGDSHCSIQNHHQRTTKDHGCDSEHSEPLWVHQTIEFWPPSESKHSVDLIKLCLRSYSTSKRSRPVEVCCVPCRYPVWTVRWHMLARLDIPFEFAQELMWTFTNSDAMASALDKHAMDSSHRIAWRSQKSCASNPLPH